jgi:hypothetical protein
VIAILWLVASLTAFGQVQIQNVEHLSSSGGVDGCHLSQWCWEHDPGTPGESVGSSWLYGPFRRFDVVWKGFGGERFHVNLGASEQKSLYTTFTVDTWIYFNKLASVNNIEIDLNQVIPNGDTVIFGMQCNFPRGVWQYTTNVSGQPHWNDSNVACSKKWWTGGLWHHVILKHHRDSAGNVAYDWVNFDTTTANFVGAFGPSNFSLGWEIGQQVANFQVDGDGTFSGTSALLNLFTITAQ